ncbi:MAG TPA: hypothetical protein VJ371_05930, partial [Streptosporangiaceae bacterium]|nr:hypothetical protein [Streptosporangiaceae bacterium]
EIRTHYPLSLTDELTLIRQEADIWTAAELPDHLVEVIARFEEGGTVESGELVPATELLQRVGDVPGLARIMARLGMEGGESFGQAAAAVEFALEGLYLMRRLSKDSDGGTSVYGS